jgi:hypothetical protein
VTEAEWLADDLWDRFEVYDYRDRDRLRAVCCACARRVLDAAGPAAPATFAAVVDVAERYAGGRCTRPELLAARKSLRAAIRALPPATKRGQLVGAFAELTDDTFEGFEYTLHCAGGALKKYRGRQFRAEKVVLSGLLRDVFGNPCRPRPEFATEWRTDTATTLALQMYDSRDFSAMPILADALQDAGCDNDDILSHCRDTSLPHVRGCWVVDLVLGRDAR